MVAQTAVNVLMITAHMATTSAVGLLTDATTTLNITAIALCLQPPAPAAVPSEGVLRRRTHILTLEYETRLPLPIQHGVTSTGTIEGDASIELIITIDEADRLIPPSRGTRLLNGPQDRPQKPPILLKDPLCPREEAPDRDLKADLQARTLSAAPAAQAAAVTQTAAPAMVLGPAPFSRQRHTHLLSHVW